MQIKSQTSAYLFSVITTTGDLTTDGKPVQRTSVPAQYQRNYNAVHGKLLSLVEVGISSGEESPEFVKFSKDFTAPEGKKIVAERFVDGDLELTEGEKAFVKFCLKRDELPTVGDEVLDEVDALTK